MIAKNHSTHLLLFFNIAQAFIKQKRYERRIVPSWQKYCSTVVKKSFHHVNPEKPDVPLNKNDAFQKVQKRRVQEKR